MMERAGSSPISERTCCRRTWLQAVAASALGVIGLPFARSKDFDAGKAALQKAAAAGPGPARDKLLGLNLRHPAVPLPFDPNAIPGFSCAAHEVHFSHHYLEYLWRWENGERELLKLAAELGVVARTNTEGDKIATLRDRILEQAETVRQSANMVMLHNSYWSTFSVGDPARKPEAQMLANQLPGSEPPDKLTWLLLLGPIRRIQSYYMVYKDSDAEFAVDSREPFAAEGLHRVFSMEASFPFSYAALAAVDCLDHSWLLDFDSFRAYLLQVLLNCSPTGWKRWHGLLEVQSTSTDTRRSQWRPVMDPMLQIGFSESGIRERNVQLAAAATERPVAEPLGGPADRVRKRIEALLHQLGESSLDPTQILEGLRFAVGPEGYVGVATPLLYFTDEVVLIHPARPSGLVDSVVVSGVPGQSVNSAGRASAT
ncbi:MAG: hypothetical protein ACR2IE_05130 [Candidatus Sumerlaeaceae bacterium]